MKGSVCTCLSAFLVWLLSVGFFLLQGVCAPSDPAASVGVLLAARHIVKQAPVRLFPVIFCCRVSAHPQTLPHLLECYKRLEVQYGADVVQEWLRRAPPVIRNANEVRC
jgi:hypothetical protein